MGTKTLSITNEVYDKLKRRKLPGESFSDTSGRLVDRGNLSDCAGAWKDLSEEEFSMMVETINELRKQANRDLYQGLS